MWYWLVYLVTIAVGLLRSYNLLCFWLTNRQPFAEFEYTQSDDSSGVAAYGITQLAHCYLLMLSLLSANTVGLAQHNLRYKI